MTSEGQHLGPRESHNAAEPGRRQSLDGPAEPRSNPALADVQQPYCILICVPAARTRALALWATRTHRRVVRLNLGRVQDRVDLYQRFAAAFEFPFMVNDMDAVIGLASELTWWPLQPGYLLIVEGTGDADSRVILDTARMLPSIVNRWRSQETPFTVALECPDRLRAAACSGVAEANDRLAAHGSLPWPHPGTGPVCVISVSTDPADTCS